MSPATTIKETLCLDYANSAEWSTEDEHVDVLRTPEMLARWGRRLHLLGDNARPPSAAELRRARALRDALYRLFSSISDAEKPTRNDLDVLMSNYRDAVNHASVMASDDVFKLDWPARDPRKVRYGVATDAVALLQDPDRLSRVSRCPGRGCGWLFLNTSGRRRWCSMSTCGSRDKMRRLHQRRKQEDLGHDIA